MSAIATRVWLKRAPTATLPDPLNIVFFTNSGSEANELALRLARTYTGRRDVAVLDVAYHGTTTSLIDLSPYKHDGAGGSGPAPWVHVAPMPDAYRGPHRGNGAGKAYGDEVRATLSKAKDGAAAFIAESALGCGGQIILPDGFLTSAYHHARAAGAVCIADEVQTGMAPMPSPMAWSISIPLGAIPFHARSVWLSLT